MWNISYKHCNYLLNNFNENYFLARAEMKEIQTNKQTQNIAYLFGPAFELHIFGFPFFGHALHIQIIN